MTSKTRVLIVGVGSIGERHLRCFQATGRVQLALCEVQPELRSRIAVKYGIDRTYGNLDSALADAHDAAVVATPAHLHVSLAQKLAAAGVHLFIEKPLSTNLDGIDLLEEIIRRQHLVAAVAYIHRAHPVLAKMQREIAAGRFGRPVQLIAQSGHHFPTARPAYRETYYKNHATGGGAVQDALTHLINAGEWLVGPVDHLVADAAHQVLDGVEVEDTVAVLTRQDGVLGSYSLNQHQAPEELTITVICEEGTCRFQHHRCRWCWTKQPGETWHDEQFEPLQRDAVFVRQAHSLLDSLDGTEPPCTLQQGLQTLRVNLGVLASVREKAWVTISERPHYTSDHRESAISTEPLNHVRHCSSENR